MNNYISKENAIGLKEIGYAEPTVSRYKDGINGMYHDVPQNHNQHEGEYSAPNFLDAADWLFNEHRIHFRFVPEQTEVKNIQKGNAIMFYTRADHRNAAIAHAIVIVKERREKGGGE